MVKTIVSLQAENLAMKKQIAKLLRNDLFMLAMNGVFLYIGLMAVIMATLNVPPDTILDSNLKEVLLVFEE